VCGKDKYCSPASSGAATGTCTNKLTTYVDEGTAAYAQSYDCDDSVPWQCKDEAYCKSQTINGISKKVCMARLVIDDVGTCTGSSSIWLNQCQIYQHCKVSTQTCTDGIPNDGDCMSKAEITFIPGNPSDGTTYLLPQCVSDSACDLATKKCKATIDSGKQCVTSTSSNGVTTTIRSPGLCESFSLCGGDPDTYTKCSVLKDASYKCDPTKVQINSKCDPTLRCLPTGTSTSLSDYTCQVPTVPTAGCTKDTQCPLGKHCITTVGSTESTCGDGASLHNLCATMDYAPILTTACNGQNTCSPYGEMGNTCTPKPA